MQVRRTISCDGCVSVTHTTSFTRLPTTQTPKPLSSRFSISNWTQPQSQGLARNGSNWHNQMRRLILFLTILSAGSASAVDYVQCDAMRNAFIRINSAMEKASVSAYERALSGSAMNDKSVYERTSAARSAAEEPYQKQLKQIKADYKKAGCI